MPYNLTTSVTPGILSNSECMRHTRILRIILIYSLFLPMGAFCSTSYHIGNSLTWDMQPLGLSAMAALAGRDHQTGYHIRSGMHLDYIWNNPNDVTITNSFGNFVTALSSYDWDYVTIQPHHRTGSTLGLDQAAITNFIDLTLAGPSQAPVFYIYSAWPRLSDDYQAFWNQPIPNDPDQITTHAREYFTALHNNLISNYSNTIQIFVIPVGEVLFRLDQEFRQGNFPGFNDASDLYRDSAHLTMDIGRFIAATTTYATIFRENPTGLTRPSGHYLKSDGTTSLTDDLRIQIQNIVWEVVSRHPESGIDITPDTFSFTSQTGVNPGISVTSNAITISGINAATPISIAGGEYAVNGGTYTSSVGTVVSGDNITVKTDSSINYSTTTSAVLSIAGMSNTFGISTLDKPAGPANNGSSGCTLSARNSTSNTDFPMILLLVLLAILWDIRRMNRSEFSRHR